MRWLMRWLRPEISVVPGPATPPAQPGPATRITEWTIGALFGLGGTMLVAIVLFGILHSWTTTLARGAGFIFWGLATAFVAFLVGGGAGMLFGLPTARQVISTGAAGAEGSSGERATGYIESTSLEQIADFLVKGLVALSLTTFGLWVDRFDALAGNITATMLGATSACRAVCPMPDRVPGGLLLAGFALLGFLIGYLAMRRWFIAEMMTARNEEQELLRQRKIKEQQLVDDAKADGRQGIGSSSASNPDASQMVAEKVADVGVALAIDSAKSGAAAIKEKAGQPGNDDDPWKNAFGGLSTVRGFELSATVSPLVSDPDNFQVDLLVKVPAEALPEALGTEVAYYLHPTFGSKPYTVKVRGDGTAPLQIFSYGGFTVGALMYDGTTLELDLAELPGVPQKFRER